jgi:hypothetical protein
MDDLARTLAGGGMSRREALKRAFVGAIGAALALLLPARRALAAGVPRGCAAFCSAAYGEDTPEATSCIAMAKQQTGPCYQFGPQSPGCATNNCPSGTACVSASPYYQYTSPQPGSFICVPV